MAMFRRHNDLRPTDRALSPSKIRGAFVAATAPAVLVLVPFLALIVFGATFLLSEDRRQKLQSEVDLTETSLSTAAVITNQALDHVNRALIEDVRLLVMLDATHRSIRSPEIRTRLREALIQQSLSLHPIISMSVLDRNGEWIVSSRYNSLPPYPRNPRRPVYRAAVDGPSFQSFLLPMEDSPVVGGFKTIVLGRAARATDGHLIGIVLAFPLIDALKEPFSMMAADDRWIFLTRTDGNDVLVSPQSTGRIPAWMKQGWVSVLARGGGHFEATDGQGKRWIVVLSGHPDSLVVYTVIKPAFIVLGIRRSYETTVILAGLVMASMALLLSSLWARQRWLTHQKNAAAFEAHQELVRTLAHDPATGLFNHAGLKELLNQTIALNSPSALLTIGLHGLGTILQMHGSDAEDCLLLQVADRIKKVISDKGVAARLNGDVFVVALYGDNVEAISSALVGELEQPYHLAEISSYVDVYIGIVRTSGSCDWRVLLRDSGIAMLRAKDSPIGCFRWFEPEVDNRLRERLHLTHDLRSAIGTDQLYMVYQPIYALTAGRIVGFEALMRWEHPSRGQVPPEVSIQLAEKTGHLLPVERMVRRSPFEAAANWPEDLFVAVNCPAHEFRDPELSDRLLGNLRKAGLSADRCCLEVTETALLQQEEIVLSNMWELKRLGLKLALDDFGSGHSSLSYLHRFPFDRIKIDRGFIQDLGRTTVATAIVEATVTLCTRLGIEVVAEGVETLVQLEALAGFGCSSMQGYLIGRPMAEGRVLEFLKAFRLDPGTREAMASLPHPGDASTQRW